MKNYLITLTLFFSSVLFVSCFQSKIEYLPLETSISVKLPDEDGFDDSILKQNKSILDQYGWSYENGNLSLTLRFPDMDVKASGGYQLHTDSNSQINIHGIPKESLDEITIQLNGRDDLALILQNGSYVINSDLFFDIMEGKGCCQNEAQVQSVNDGGQTPTPPRCQDYNGPLGNGQNDQSGLQRIINFIGSDCNIAMNRGLCIDEHINEKGGCYNSHGGQLCSELIN